MFSLKHYKSFSFVAVWHQFVWYCELADACPKRYITRPLATLLSLTVSNINFFPHFFSIEVSFFLITQLALLVLLLLARHHFDLRAFSCESEGRKSSAVHGNDAASPISSALRFFLRL